MNKFRILNTIAFVVFCSSVGEVTAILLTGWAYNVSTSQIFEALKEPINSNRSLIIVLLSFSTLFRFLIIPTLYLVLYDIKSINFGWIESKIRFTPLLLSILLIISIIPFISILIELNYNVEFTGWLSGLEIFFREREEKARQLTNFLLLFTESKDLIIAVLIIAIIPGVVEEFFFRGLVQTQLQNILKNHHYAIFFSAFLFSLLHFQFYGIIPRMIVGVLLGYIFFWSKNIWYPCVAHITNNLIGVLGAYFLGPQVMDPKSGSFISIALFLPSIIITALILLCMKKFFIKFNLKTGLLV